MVLDTFAQRARYLHLHPAFAQAFEFAALHDLGALPPGRHVIDGERLYLSIDHKEGRGRGGARLESHRRYIDIQLTLDGAEEIGWRPLSSCAPARSAFDDTRDIAFYDDDPDSWLSVPRDRFAIFFPEDAHAPLGGIGLLKKAIFKIAVTADSR